LSSRNTTSSGLDPIWTTPALIIAEGFEPSKQKGWFKIPSMFKAVRFVKWILEAYEKTDRAFQP
jgi:hypothetical protein